MKGLYLFFGAVSLALLISAGAAFGQTVQGDIVGTITDSQGKVVPGASVKIINEASGAVRQLTSDSKGDYQGIGFYLGTYRIEVELSGFEKAVVPGVSVTPVTVKRIDVTLSVGSALQTVTVTGGAPTVQTVGATVNNDFDNVYYDKPIEDVSRSGYALSGAQWAVGGSSGTSGIDLWSGASGGETDLEIEGAIQPATIDLFTDPGSIQETAIVSGAPPAEYPRPVVANSTIKSGSNRLHGSWIESLSQQWMNTSATPFTQAPRGGDNPLWRYEFWVGGPVYIPKLYNGKNKTFFFVDFWKPRTSAITATEQGTIPTMAMRQGNYNGFPITPKNPATGLPYPNDMVPVSQTATNIMNTLYPPYTYINGGFANNVTVPFWDTDGQNDLTLKFDQNVGQKNVISFTYFRGVVAAVENLTSSTPPTGNLNFDNSENQTTDNHRFNLAYTRTFSPTVVWQSRATASRWIQLQTIGGGAVNTTTPVLGANVLQQWGIQGITPLGLSGYPGITINGWNAIDVPNASAAYYTNYQFASDLTWVHNKHTFKGGVTGLKYLQDSPFVPGFGSFTFNGQITGEPFADFLLGDPGSFSRSSPRPWIARRNWEWGAFGQDDWRVSRKLTLSYGLRWDHFGAPYDKNDEYFNFNLKTGQIVVPDQRALGNISAAWNTAAIPVVLASAAGYPAKLINPMGRFLPRFGFAYRPTSSDKLVIRGGYGVYQGTELFAPLQTGGPFAITQSFTNSIVNGAAQYSFPNPFPSGTGPIAGAATGSSVSTNFRPEYNQSWNLTVEKQLKPGWGLRVSYLGNDSVNLAYAYNANTPLLNTTGFLQSNRPYPQFQSVTAYVNGANSHYNALEVLLHHPFANGLDLQVSYTEQRARDDQGAGGPSGFTRDDTPSTIDYAYNRERDWGNNAMWPHHEFDTTWAWALPFGQGRRYASNLKSTMGAGGRVLNQVIGGWSSTGVWDWHSGLFYTPNYSGYDPGNIDQFSGRAEVVPGCNVYPGGKRGANVPIFNTNCFAIPANGTLGNATINSLVGPHMWVASVNPYKEFRIPHLEGGKIQVGVNIYNLFNHSVYGPATGTITSTSGAFPNSTFVRRSTEYANSRKMTLNARFIF